MGMNDKKMLGPADRRLRFADGCWHLARLPVQL